MTLGFLTRIRRCSSALAVLNKMIKCETWPNVTQLSPEYADSCCRRGLHINLSPPALTLLLRSNLQALHGGIGSTMVSRKFSGYRARALRLATHPLRPDFIRGRPLSCHLYGSLRRELYLQFPDFTQWSLTQTATALVIGNKLLMLEAIMPNCHVQTGAEQCPEFRTLRWPLRHHILTAAVSLRMESPASLPHRRNGKLSSSQT